MNFSALDFTWYFPYFLLGIPDIVDNLIKEEDKRIEREVAEDEYKYHEEIEKEKQRKIDLAESLMKFKMQDQIIKEQRTQRAKQDILIEKEVEEEQFKEFLKRMNTNETNRMSKAQLYKR